MDHSTEQLKMETVNISEDMDALENQWRQLKGIMKASRVYWEGDAGREHQTRFAETAEEIDTLIRCIKENSVALFEYAGLKNDAHEADNRSDKALPSDLII